MLRSVYLKVPALAVSINTESGDIIHIVHMVAYKMKEFVDFNSRHSVKSQCIGKYSIINKKKIKKVLGHITTCLQSKVWGWALRWIGGVYIHISSKWGMGVLKIVGPSMARYGKFWVSTVSNETIQLYVTPRLNWFVVSQIFPRLISISQDG